jgi:hypothetical protein
MGRHFRWRKSIENLSSRRIEFTASITETSHEWVFSDEKWITRIWTIIQVVAIPAGSFIPAWIAGIQQPGMASMPHESRHSLPE